MKLAIVGDRGIPARYSGFSTLVEEVAVRLVRDHGAQVTVYCRRQYFDHRPGTYRGVRCVYFPAPGGKSFESIMHSSLSLLHCALRRADLVFVVDPGNGPFVWPLALRGVPRVFHTDGLGWQRTKWNKLQRQYYKWAERVTVRLGTWLVTDSRQIQTYYREQYNADSTFIPYGSVVGHGADDRCLAEHGLKPGQFYLVVARMEPENNVDTIICEYKRSRAGRPLIVVGGARYESKFAARVFAASDERVRCIGPVYDAPRLNGLYANCYVYLHGHEVGGTNPSLLRAMGAGAACVAIDVPFHREVLADTGEYFNKEPGALAEMLNRLDGDAAQAEALGRHARDRAARFYRWDAVAAAYDQLFRGIVQTGASGRRYRQGGDDEVYCPSKFFTLAEATAV